MDLSLFSLLGGIKFKLGWGFSMKLVDNWKEAWSWLSMQFLTAAFVWVALPQETQDTMLSWLPDGIEPNVTSILLVAAAVGRVIDQQKVKPDVDNQ